MRVMALRQLCFLICKKKPVRRLGCMLEMEKSYENAAKKYGEWNAKGRVKESIRRMMLRVIGI